MKHLIFFTLLIFSSCILRPHKPSQNELQQTMDAAKFDTAILNNFPIYQRLGEVLSKYCDTIVALTDSKLHHIDTTVIGEYCFHYYYNSVAQNTNIKDMPDFVYRQVDSLWNLIGEDNITNIDVCNDKTILVNTLMTEAAHNTLVVHQLIWNIQPFDNNHAFDLFKDTLLTENCTYRLGVSENFDGW